jgi:hypothetical protein
MKRFFLLTAVVLTGCSDNVAAPQQDSILLFRDGEVKKSPVVKFGVYCTAAWYQSIEHLLLNSDGTSKNRPFEYKWSLREFRSDEDKQWFASNCKEPI